MTQPGARRVLPALAILLMIAAAPAGGDSDDAWVALARGGHVAVIRHGHAPPGHGGDPRDPKLEECRTQRNLDDTGRGQAKALGDAFRAHGVRVDRIVSSPLCRCRETGELMAVGAVETSAALLPDAGGTLGRTLELKQMVSSWRGPGTLVLVTHAATASPLGFLLEEAETVVLRPAPEDPRGGMLVGRIAPPR
jgi:phosphohistidine phosphatase SixA